MACAEPDLKRVSGTVESTTDNSVTVKMHDGTKQEIMLADAKFVVVKSKRSEISEGKVIGIATKGDNPPVALEVAIFPGSMKGTAKTIMRGMR